MRFIGDPHWGAPLGLMKKRIALLSRLAARAGWSGIGRKFAGIIAVGITLAGGCALATPLTAWGGRLWSAIVVPGLRIGNTYDQVHMEQHFSIRISPGAGAVPPNAVFELEQIQHQSRVEERKVGRCLPATAIAGVQAADNNRLLLFLRDQRIIVASLEKACQATDFYSGFYVERNADGQICIARDRLHARSGANCRIRDMRAVVEAPTRRFP